MWFAVPAAVVTAAVTCVGAAMSSSSSPGQPPRDRSEVDRSPSAGGEAHEQQRPEQPRPSSPVAAAAPDLGCGAQIEEALACGQCNAVLFGPDDFVTARAAGLKPDAVYAYELDDVCGHDKLWVYSATNPHERRFDVARVKSRVVERESIRLGGVAPTADHTWFPPFAWNMASCARCGHHLGWGFYDTSKLAASTAAPSPPPETSSSAPAGVTVPATNDSSSDDEEGEEEEEEDVAAPEAVTPEFAGVILTNCTAVSATPSGDDESKKSPLCIPSADELRVAAAAQRSYAEQRRAVVAALQAAPNQLVASQLAMLLMHLDKTPSARAELLPQLVDAARRLTLTSAVDTADSDDSDDDGEDDEEEEEETQVRG